MTVEFRKEKTLDVALKKWIKKIKTLRGEYTDNHAKLAGLVKGDLRMLLDTVEGIPAENVVNLEDLKEVKKKHFDFFDDTQKLITVMAEQLRHLIMLTEDINGMEFSSDIPPSVIKLLQNEETLLEKFDEALLDLSKSIPNYLQSKAPNEINETIRNNALLAFANFQDGIQETEKSLDSLFNILRETQSLAKDLERSRIS